jgi:hypothetical protein
MLLLGVVGAAYIALSSAEVTSAANYRDGIAAQYLAEAGARRAIVELDKNSAWAGVSEWEEMGSGVAKGKYKVTIAGTQNNRTVTSTGVVGNAARKIELILTLANGNTFPYPVFSDNHLMINNGFVVEGGEIATSKRDQVTDNRSPTGTVLKEINDVTLPSIPVTFNKNDYDHGDTTTLSGTPNTGDYNLAGLYFINGDFTTNNGVNLKTVDGDTATIYVEGNVTLSGNVNGNITIIAKQDLTTNSGSTMTGTINLYVGQDTILNRSMTGDITVMSNNDLTINSSASELNKAKVYSKHDIIFNAGVHLTGVLIADNKLTLNGAKVTYDPLGFGSSSSVPLTINSWAPK